MNHESFWLGNIPISGYIKNNNKIYKIRLTVLCDNKPFASAELHSVQYKGTILGHITYVTNKGYFHPAFQFTNGIIKARDFRIRFWAEGDVRDLDFEKIKSGIKITCDNLYVIYKVPYVKMGDLPISFEYKKTDDKIIFDTVILNSQKKSKICMNELKRAICQFSLMISSTQKDVQPAKNTFNSGSLISTLGVRDYSLMLKTPCKPIEAELLNINDSQYINNVELEKFITTRQSLSEQYEFIATSSFDIKSIQHSSNISERIFSAFENTTFNNIKSQIDVIFETLDRENLPLNEYKRYAMYCLRYVFDYAKSVNTAFEELIGKNFMDIYNKISLTTDYVKVKQIINKVIDILLSDYEMLVSKTRKQTLVTDVINFVENNYKNPDLSLTMVAAEFGVSESYITRVFKKITNTTYVNHVIRIRMEKAKDLLLKNESVEHIITECGYLNVSSFKRSFKKYTGMTISDWKKNPNRIVTDI